jgi:hypothetical protein
MFIRWNTEANTESHRAVVNFRALYSTDLGPQIVSADRPSHGRSQLAHATAGVVHLIQNNGSFSPPLQVNEA